MSDDEAHRLRKLVEPLRVEPGRKVHLARDFDPRYKAEFLSKVDADGVLDSGIELLADYQARLSAQDTWALLVVLQAIDAGGKDGTIRHVMSGVNPQGVRVSSFKVPSDEELDHDYLWRYEQRLPARGEIGIFNRSHYEEVLVVRVHPAVLERQQLPPEANFQFFSGTSSRFRKRSRCSSLETLRKSLTTRKPLSTRCRSQALISRYRRSQTCFPVSSGGGFWRSSSSGWTRTTSTSS